jgi:hypothetical protein
MVLAFTTMLAMMGHRLSNVSQSAYDNYLLYYNKAASHNIAASLANIASQVVYRVPNSFPGYKNISMGGRTVSDTCYTDSVLIKGVWTQIVRLKTWSNYLGYKDTVAIVWGTSRFSRFAYYSQNEGGNIQWVTGDTVDGPFHTQSQMQVSGNPVFQGKATTLGGVKTNSGKAKFNGGYQSPVDIKMPADFGTLVAAAQKPNGRYLSGMDVTMTFHADSTITIKRGAKPDTVVKLSTYCPNGAMVISGGNLRVKGVFTGLLTIAVLKGGVSGKGFMYFDSSVAYKHPPSLTDSTSTDLLGLCADTSLVIADSADTGHYDGKGIDIQAALYSRTGGLTAQNYDQAPARGYIRLVGGLSAGQRQAVGQMTTPIHGYYKSYRYDGRLMTASPPYFPTTGSYEILSWYEK